jgi:murein peptide amidase A
MLARCSGPARRLANRSGFALGFLLCIIVAATAVAVFAAAPAHHATAVAVFAAAPAHHARPRAATDLSADGSPIGEWAIIGHSRQGRAIRVARFGSGTRRLLVVGGVHGAEFGGAVARQLASRLAADPGAVPAGWSVHVIPSVNPDGASLQRRGNARNVDLNRNLPTSDWRRRLNAGDPAAAHCNGGSGPASEPETKTLVRYLRQGFACVISLHSRGGFLDFNGPHGRSIAARMSRVTGLPLLRIPYQGAITGSLGEYVPAVYRVPVITVELSRPRLSGRLFAAVSAACLAADSAVARRGR